MEGSTVFIVSDCAAVCDSVRELVASAELRAETFASLEELLGAVDRERRGCLALDVRAADLQEPKRLARTEAACARWPGVLITERGDVPMAVRALKAGATDIVQKPYRDENLLESIRQALAADVRARH